MAKLAKLAKSPKPNKIKKKNTQIPLLWLVVVVVRSRTKVVYCRQKGKEIEKKGNKMRAVV